MSYQTIQTGATERFFTVVARSSGDPITSGTVNYYLRAKSGDNAGKWWRDSDQSWQAGSIANPMAHNDDGHWEIDLTESPFSDGVRYLEYVKESGDLHVPDARHLIASADSVTTLKNQLAATKVAIVSPYDPDKRRLTLVQNMSYLQGTPVGPLLIDVSAYSGIVAGDAVHFGGRLNNGQTIDASGVVIDVGGINHARIELDDTDTALTLADTEMSDINGRWELKHETGGGVISPLYANKELHFLRNLV
ncbi:hypothetical protein [Roseiconus lacunae]|uniref:Uncharacterized protein n=1 Tax=Roseiconus lacunae TaxID=2605694 RepID=A0ABT7PH72_9BACT|nr:hypothetical protein [Roseiconus lacunae]MDM4015854.1 hypothetical protein [Roseiconus lacunae]